MCRGAHARLSFYLAMPGSLDPDPISTITPSPGPWTEDADPRIDYEIEDASGNRVARIFKTSDVTGFALPWVDNKQLIMDAIGYGTQAESLAAELVTAQADLATAQADLATAQADLATAQADLATAQADLATAVAELATTIVELNGKRMELDDTEQAIRRARAEHELVVRKLRRKRRKALRQAR